MSGLSEKISAKRWPIFIGLVAVLVRLIYLLELSALPEFQVPMVDEKWHWEWANEILTKSFWGEGAYFRAPLYPYFLAFLSWVSSGSILISKILQSLLCFFTTVFIYLLAEKLFERRAAIIAGFAYAFYGTLIFYETSFLIPVIFLFFTMWGLWRFIDRFESEKKIDWITTGLLFGMAAIARPNILLVMPFLALWKFYKVSSPQFSKKIITPIFLAIGVILAILPVTIRNIVVTGKATLISSQGGINLYLGNNPTADGLTMLMPEVDLDESISWRQFAIVTAQAANDESGLQLDESQQSSFWSGKAVDYILENPSKFIGLLWKKSVYLVSGFENSDNADIYYQRNKSKLYSVLVWNKLIYFPFGFLLPFAFGSFFLLRRQWSKLAPLYIFMLAYIPSIILFLVTARHRLVLIPLLIILVAGVISEILSKHKKRLQKDILLSFSIVVLSLILINQRYYDLDRDDSEFQIHFNAGIAAERINDYQRAESEYILADQEFSYSAPLINNLAHVQFLLGKYRDAERNYIRAIQIKPNYGQAFHNYALLKQKTGGLDSAQVLYLAAIEQFEKSSSDSTLAAKSFVNLADTYERSGNIDGASIAYQRALLLDSSNPETHFKASSYLARQADYLFSDSLFQEGLKYGEPSSSDWYNYGLSALRRGQFTAVLDRMQQAIALNEQFHQAYFSIAAAYYELGAPSDSVYRYLNQCLTLNKSFEPALRLKAKLK